MKRVTAFQNEAPLFRLNLVQANGAAAAGHAGDARADEDDGGHAEGAEGACGPGVAIGACRGYSGDAGL